MNRIFKGQDFYVDIDTGDALLPTATSLIMRYKKPRIGTNAPVYATGTPTVSGTKATLKITAAQNDAVGEWRFELEYIINGEKWVAQPQTGVPVHERI